MAIKYKKITKQQRKNTNNQSRGVTITPVFKNPIDINKLGNAFLMLAAKQAEIKVLKSDKGSLHDSSHKKCDTGGQNDKIIQ